MTLLILILVNCGLAYILKQKLVQIKSKINEIESLKKELSKFEPIQNLDQEINNRQGQLDQTHQVLQQAIETLNEYKLRQDLEESTFYRPRFVFEDIAHYAEALQLLRDAEKELIRQKRAYHDLEGLEVKGDSKGIGKLGLSAFNSEADLVINSVKYDNFEQCTEKMRITFNKINNLIGPSNVILTTQYLDLKIKEMALAYDFKEKEQQSKDEQAELKAQMREEEKARTEAEKAREEAIEEQQRYQAALEEVRKEMESKSEAERAEYEGKLKALQNKYDAATAERERATAMAQITKKGHVYVISNIGSFGENVFKIGLTRRKDPLERVKELSDASVPFNFDVHAVIYAEDAPGLEHTLHQHFDKRRMNKINQRKEFFRVTLEDIAKICKDLGYQAQLTMVSEAREYRETIALENQAKAA